MVVSGFVSLVELTFYGTLIFSILTFTAGSNDHMSVEMGKESHSVASTIHL